MKMSGRELEEDASYYSLSYGAEKSMLPQIPPSGAISLNLSPLDRASSVIGTSTQSMRTSSFAMSDDMSETKVPHQPDSLRIRKAYSRPPRSRISTVETSIPESDTTDYYDEKDFQNTDRYVFVSTGVILDMDFCDCKVRIVILLRQEIELLFVLRLGPRESQCELLRSIVNILRGGTN